MPLPPMRREKALVFLSEWDNFTRYYEDAAWNNGFRGLIVHGHAGEGPPEEGHPSTAKVNEWKARGWDVGCYGTFGDINQITRLDPIACAQAANGIIVHLGYTFYVANIEPPWDRAREKAFLREFRRLQPKFTFWLSSEITNQRPWDLYFKKGAIVPNYPVATCWQPQCYENVNRQATPEQAMFWATRQDGHGHGIPADQVKATLGTYEAPDGSRFSPIEYVEQLDRLNQPGFSIWLGETARMFDYDTFGRAIRTLGIAKL